MPVALGARANVAGLGTLHAVAWPAHNDVRAKVVAAVPVFCTVNCADPGAPVVSVTAVGLVDVALGIAIVALPVPAATPLTNAWTVIVPWMPLVALPVKLTVTVVLAPPVILIGWVAGVVIVQAVAAAGDMVAQYAQR